MIMNGGATINNGGAPYGFAYRAGQTIRHLEAAVQRGVEKGHWHLPFQIKAIATQLEKVLKVTPT